MGIEELASHIFAYDLDRPSLAVAEALARKLWDLGYRRIGVNEPSTEGLPEDMDLTHVADGGGMESLQALNGFRDRPERERH